MEISLYLLPKILQFVPYEMCGCQIFIRIHLKWRDLLSNNMVQKEWALDVTSMLWKVTEKWKRRQAQDFYHPPPPPVYLLLRSGVIAFQLRILVYKLGIAQRSDLSLGVKIANSVKRFCWNTSKIMLEVFFLRHKTDSWILQKSVNLPAPNFLPCSSAVSLTYCCKQ